MIELKYRIDCVDTFNTIPNRMVGENDAEKDNIIIQKQIDAKKGKKNGTYVTGMRPAVTPKLSNHQLGEFQGHGKS